MSASLVEHVGRRLSVDGARFDVWEAWSTAGDPLIVKRARRPATAESEARLAHEARTLRALRDVDGVARLRGAGPGWICLERHGQATLAQCVGAVAADDVATALAQTVCALHARGVAHRDIKPSNVVLDERGAPWLIDFELAVGPGPVAEFWRDWRQAYGGTVPYAAPELVLGVDGARNPAVDVFGLGATIYQLMTGRPPFSPRALDGDWRTAHARAVARGTPPPSALGAVASASLDSLVLAMLDAKPSRRPTSREVMCAIAERWTSPA